jgi:transcriptional regulator with XRE-family HTH domain
VRDTVSILVGWQELGERIKRLREKRGLTQAQLAERTGLSTIYIRKLEAGERTAPSFKALERLAQVLNATLRVDLIDRRKGGHHGR